MKPPTEATALTLVPCPTRKSHLFQVQSSQFQVNPATAIKCHESSPTAVPVLLHLSKTVKTTIGRGHDATVQIGKTNKRVSREHIVIEHKPQLNGFELTILSPNGALVDHIIFIEGEHVPLVVGTEIEIVGTKLIFQGSMEEVSEPIQHTPSSAESEKTHTPKPKIKTKKKHPHSIHNHKKKYSLEDEIIQVLVYTRKSTMTCGDILKRLEGQTMSTVSKALSHSSVIGCVKRLGMTADGTPKEDLYYYRADHDNDTERKKKYSDVGRSARKCTMKDTQYFFKIPPKLSQHKTGNKLKKKIHIPQEEEDEDEGLRSSSSGDVSDMEVYELFRDVQ
ncbi:hypothetical protein BDB01DRAFT_833870 [Pilobolus umbonatus]|nr:hypothetical protein BDB01DRAFT_833870 [Pilobolus umbonatus]